VHVMAWVVVVIAVNMPVLAGKIIAGFALNCIAGLIDFKLWPVEEWKTCGAYRCFNK
jgi:hypothetical protein